MIGSFIAKGLRWAAKSLRLAFSPAVFLAFLLAACSTDPLVRAPTDLPVNKKAPEFRIVYTPLPATSPPATTPPTNFPSPSPTFDQTVLSSPTIEKPIKPHPIIVISFDGAPASQVYPMMEKGSLPAFAELASRGIRAEAMLSVDPSLTAPAHASLITGAYPGKTGIVSNLYHNPNDSFYWYRSGFDQPLDQVDPVWVTASRAGLRTASLFVAGGTPFLPGQSADYTVAYGARDAYSRLEKIKLSSLQIAWEGETPISYSPLLEGAWILEKVSQVYVLALDSQDDNRVNYDTFVLDTQRVFSPGNLVLKAGEWGALLLDPAREAGAYFLIQKVTPAKNQLKMEIYHSGVYHNNATPRPLLEELNRKFGFFPAGPDSYALEHGWITPQQFLEMLQRSTTWMMEVSLWVYQTYQPDLMFTWLDPFDAAGHAAFPDDSILLANEESLYEQAARSADAALGKLLKQISLDETNLIALSDHGMARIHSTVNLNTLLEEAGLLVLDQKDYVVVEKSQAIAFASGGSANIYINLEGREKDGIVPVSEYPAVLQKIQDLLGGLVDPQSSQPVISRMVVKEDLDLYHLDHLHSGDIFLQANPGYNLDSHRGWANVFSHSGYAGQHGYDRLLPEMGAIFIAAGPELPDAPAVIPSIQIIDVAPTLLNLLGLPPDNRMDGILIPSIVH
jgi:predicted AlkP superfamily phosphohydrolase/phosphomutase